MAGCYASVLTSGHPREEAATLKRRDFLQAAALAAATPATAFAQGAPKAKPPPGILVNDVHSAQTSARVFAIAQPDTLEGVRQAFAQAKTEEKSVCIAGGRHSMGGQPFAADGVLIDTRKMNRVLAFDAERGLIELESGVEWPQLLETLTVSQQGSERHWTFAQKQAGADRMTIGGSLSANMHGSGLALAPFVNDIESFKLLDAKDKLHTCSRTENRELFRLAIGGFGLFGFVPSATLRLVPRRRLERVVEVRDTVGLAAGFAQRIAEGFLYGDFQLSIDDRTDDYLKRGVFTCYRPLAQTSDAVPNAAARREMSERDWIELLYLAHTDKGAAFKRLSEFALSTSGQVYWSDEAQMQVYPENYHRELDRRYSAPNRASEGITEFFVEREQLEAFVGAVREYTRRERVEVIQASVRLVEQDGESYLAWARKPCACLTLHIHLEHTTRGSIRAGDFFRRLLDIALRYGGSYHLAYNRHALRQQIDVCFPQFGQFLRLKKKYDPEELFQSDWYRGYRRMYFGN
jgi:FAD/FMN-containing dehydrogenase